jgi:hypothetical protein
MERKKQSSFTKLVIFASAVVLLVSFVAINTNTTGEQTKITKTAVTDPSQVYVRSWAGAGSKDVVWDNGMHYENLLTAQMDASLPLVSEPADDFMFEVDQLVNDVHWIGGYYSGPPDDGDFNWKVTFYRDFGDGTKPGTIINTWVFSNAQVNETLIEPMSGGGYYSYSVILPTTLTFLSGEKYWVSIQGIGDIPPQSGWACHSDIILLHQAVFRSVFFGFLDWVDVLMAIGIEADMCFQLTYEEPWPDHKMHFPQLPDLIGWDVNATFPYILADDWQCSDTGELTDIHFWGSWKDLDGNPATDDFFTPMPFFNLTIYSNLPIGHPSNPYPYSIPGDPLWFWEGEIPGIPSEPPTLESWFDPYNETLICNDHIPYWRYDFFFDQAFPPPEPFIQIGGEIYWLSVTAVNIQTPYQWGWKNSRDHFEDDAILFIPTGELMELYEPPRCNWFDVYFNEMGEPDDMGSTNYYGDGWYFYEMDWWWNIWFYDNPFTYQNFKEIVLDFNIDPVGPGAYAELAINWSTDIWSLEGVPGRPPLPDDGNELLYIGRQIFPVVPGPNQITFIIPDYNPEWISIDFRAADVVINGWIYHECVRTSMDLAFVITGEDVQPPELDFGDAPDPTYPTLLANDGARHIIVPNIYLGATIDPDPDGQPDPNALGDDNDGTDDEDGVVFTSLLYPGSPAKVKVTASVPGYLNAWVDFNADGDWDDPQEKIFISKALAAGPNDLFYFVPTDAVAGPAISRFRFSTEDTLWKYTGEAPDGEVEDYEVEILEPIGDLKMHYLQPPDLEGWDILSTYPCVVADDWLCTETGPVTDIHFWGSWFIDFNAPIEGFYISIYSNIPGPPFSQPGEELWSAFIHIFVETPMEDFPQGWYDPMSPWWEHPNHGMWFRYDITEIAEPFIQEQGTIYWLSIRAEIPGAVPFEPPMWGWKTSYEHFEDYAMWGIYDPPFNWFLEPLFDPITQQPVDMAFAITGGEPVICGDANNSGAVNLSDAIYLLNYLFKGGPPPVPYMCVGDVNNSDSVNLSDAIYILNYLFKGGPPPDPNCCNPIWAK